MRENRKQKQKKKFQLCRLFTVGKAGQKNPRTESLPTAMGGSRQRGQTFADCNSESSRQRTFQKKKFLSLPTAELAASRQTIFEKIILCRLPRNQQSAKPAVRADGATWLCRLLAWQLAKDLPTVCHVAVGKSAFADPGFADCSLPTATWLCGRQSLCRLGLCLCRPGQAVGKEAFSCSVCLVLLKNILHELCVFFLYRTL